VLAPPLFGMVLPENSDSNTIFDNTMTEEAKKKEERSEAHLFYVLHFPYPSIDKNSHDNNQRMVMLFGFGKSRQGFLKKLKELKMEIYQCLGLVKVEDEKKDVMKFKERVSAILKLV